MKKNRYILAGLTAATLLATACSEIDDNQLQQEQTVPVTFYLRSAGPNTRATEDVKEGTGAENAIHTAKVWLYQSAYTEGTTNHAPLLLGYQDASFSDNAGEREITINIPKAVADAGRKLDVYAIANAASVGLGEMNAGSNEAPKSFDEFYLAGDNFKPQTLTASPGVPTDGLPMSQIAKEQTIITSGTEYRLHKIDLVRAISKIRFAFARRTGLENVEITGIEINGNLIPKNERIFPNQDATNYGEYNNITYYGDRYTNIVKTGADDTDYEQTKLIYDKSATAGSFNTALVSTSQIVQNENPELLVYQKSGKTIRDYDDMITSYVIEELDTYLRESDKVITGTIYYRYGSSNTESTTFTMSAPNDFARNHQWVVYGYFNGGKLEIVPQVLDWITGTTIDFRAESGAGLTLDRAYTQGLYDYIMWSRTEESATTYNPPMDNMSWDDNYCAISYGYSEDGRPLYSPYLEVITTSNNELTLSTDNSEFGFIEVENPNGDETEVHYSEFVDEIVISPGRNKSTYFYIVPKQQFDQVSGSSRYANVFLTESAGTSYSTSRMPWNHTLPGNATGETVQVYYVSPNNYLKADANARAGQGRQFFNLQTGGWLFYYGNGQ